MKIEIEVVISNTLSNLYDWESEDLKEDFVSFLHNEYNIDKEKLSELFDQFNSLPALERDSVSFNLPDFVAKFLN